MLPFRVQSYSVWKIRFVAALITFPSLVGAVEPEKKSVNKWEEVFIQSNIAISEFFDSIAEKIDNWIIDRPLYRKKNETNVRIENLTNSYEGKTVENVTHFNVNLRLHKVEEYFKLKFTTYDEAEERRSRRRAITPTARPRNYGASVGLFRSWGTLKTAFEPRIELRDPLKVSHSLSFERTVEFSHFEIEPKVEFFANPDKGTGIFVAFNFVFPLNEGFTLLLVNEGEYEEKRNMFSTSIGTSLIHTLSERISITYGAMSFSNNRPNYHLDAYTFSIGWNQLLYKRVMDYQLIPHLDFSRETSFKGQVGLALNLNLNF